MNTRKLVAILTSGLAFPVAAQTQAAASGEPSARAVLLRTVDADPALSQLESRAQRTPGDNAVVFKSNRWRIVALFGAPAPDAVMNQHLIALRAACKGAKGLEPADETLIATTNPWASFDSASAGRPLVAFGVVPMRAPSSACDSDLQMDRAAAARGLLLPSAISYAPSNDPQRVSVVVDGTPVAAVMLGRVPVVQASFSDEMSQLRAYVPLDALAPRGNGSLPQVELVVASADSAVSDRVALPDNVVRSIWYAALPYRLARIDPAVRSAWAVRIPSRGGELAPAVAAQERGELVTAAALSGSHLVSRNVEDRRAARIVWAQALFAGRDSAAGRMLLAEEMSVEPCLASAERVDRSFRSAVDAVRPRTRCSTSAPPKVFASGLLLPGNGQRATGRKVGAITFAVLTGLAGGYAMQQWQGSKSAYDSYRTATSTPDAVRMFDSANSQQDMARNMAITGVAIWAAGAVEAMVTEILHARRMNRVAGYGTR